MPQRNPQVLNLRPRRPKPDDLDILQGVEDCQRRGLSHRATAGELHLDTTTVTDWLTRGRAQLTAYFAGKTEELGSHGLFALHFERGAAQLEAENTQVILDARYNRKDKNFVPALVVNKARNPSEWVEARTVSLKVEGAVDHRHLLLPGGSEQELLAIVQSSLLSDRKLLPAPSAGPPSDSP